MLFFICTSIRLGMKIQKPWFARSVGDEKKLSDLFKEFLSGDFNDGAPLEEQYQAMQVRCVSVYFLFG